MQMSTVLHSIQLLSIYLVPLIKEPSIFSQSKLKFPLQRNLQNNLVRWQTLKNSIIIQMLAPKPLLMTNHRIPRVCSAL